MKRFRWSALLVLLFLGACRVQRDELASATTEDGLYEAKLYFEDRGGATLPGFFALYLSESQSDAKFTHRLLLGRVLDISDLSWNGRILTISYTVGEIDEFSNRWTTRVGDKVELRLNAQCEGICVTRGPGLALRASPLDTREEISSVRSPSGNFTALLTRESSNAAQQPLYRLRIISGRETEDEKWATMVLEVKDLKDPVLSWDGARPVLLVSYGGGEITKFQNVWQDEVAYRTGKGAYNIEIKLAPQCEGMCF